MTQSVILAKAGIQGKSAIVSGIPAYAEMAMFVRSR